MSENRGGDKGISRRSFLKLLGIGAAGTAAAVVGVPKGMEVVKNVANATLNTIERERARSTEAQKKAIEAFNNSKTSERIHTLTTGPHGANLRSVPEPPDKATDPDKNNFVKEYWEANKTHPLPYGAILVKGGDPTHREATGANWYFIPTQYDPNTKKVTGGYFSYAQNFGSNVPSSNVAQTKD